MHGFRRSTLIIQNKSFRAWMKIENVTQGSRTWCSYFFFLCEYTVLWKDKTILKWTILVTHLVRLPSFKTQFLSGWNKNAHPLRSHLPLPVSTQPLRSLSTLSVPTDSVVQNIPYTWVRRTDNLHRWLLSLRIVFGRFIPHPQRLSVPRCFVWLSNVPLHTHSTWHSSVNRHVGCTTHHLIGKCYKERFAQLLLVYSHVNHLSMQNSVHWIRSERCTIITSPTQTLLSFRNNSHPLATQAPLNDLNSPHSWSCWIPHMRII